MKLCALLVTAVPLCSGLLVPLRTVPPSSRRAQFVRLSESETTSATDVDVSPAAEAIQAEMSAGPNVYTADPVPNADGSRPINIKFDVRWFLFLSLFSIGEEPILEATAPLRELSLFGVQPFDWLISVLAGPVVRSSADGQGLHDVPTGGLVIVVAYFIHWKGWDADVVRTFRRQLQLFRDRDRL
jgi:hypothetical protein